VVEGQTLVGLGYLT